MHILIACETALIGSLMRDARRIGVELAAHGHDITYVMADPVAFAEYAPPTATEAALATPQLREPQELVLKRRHPSGFDDVMAISGFANSSQLIALCRSWARQLDLLLPDAIVGLHSPLLWLVGPCQAPTFAAGGGGSLPPTIGDTFPRLSAMAPPLAADHVMIANANLVLREFDAAPIALLTDIIGRCQQLLYGLPWLDPYLQLRQRTSLGLLGTCLPIAPIASKKQFAAFLDVFSPNIEALLLGIAGADDFHTEIFLAGATAGMTRFLQQQSNVTVCNDFAALASRLGQMSGVIHHGDADIVESCIVAGLPQLALPFTAHQVELVGSFQWMGCVMNASATDSIAQNAGMLKSFAKTASLAVHAQHHARQIRSKGVTPALDAIVRSIESSSRAQSKSFTASHAAGA